MKYHVQSYGRDGADWESTPSVVVGRFDSLTQARACVRRRLGVLALRATRRWSPDGPDVVEGYHDHPASHPDADGCGGLVIVETP